VFSALSFSEEEARKRFGFLLEALEYGARMCDAPSEIPARQLRELGISFRKT
jgi:aspartyl-tRNA synthetase